MARFGLIHKAKYGVYELWDTKGHTGYISSCKADDRLAIANLRRIEGVLNKLDDKLKNTKNHQNEK